MNEVKRSELRIHADVEQLVSALDSGSPQATRQARVILIGIVANGSTALLAQVFRGLLLAWDNGE